MNHILLLEDIPEIRAWLKKRGGLKPKMVYLSGSELMSMYRVCE